MPIVASGQEQIIRRHRFLEIESNDRSNQLDAIVEADDTYRTKAVERHRTPKPKSYLEYPEKASEN